MTLRYESEDWQSLPLLTRAELLMVLEGGKPGCITTSNASSFPRAIAQTGLVTLQTSTAYRLNPAVIVATPERLDEHLGQLLSLPARTTEAQLHRVWGKLLGYPSCCIDEYTAPWIAASSAKNQSWRFARELETLVGTTGKYPDVFDYRPPSFTPCSINCTEATNILTAWKDAVEAHDSAAADALKYENRSTGIARMIHWDWVQAYKQRTKRPTSRIKTSR